MLTSEVKRPSDLPGHLKTLVFAGVSGCPGEVSDVQKCRSEALKREFGHSERPKQGKTAGQRGCPDVPPKGASDSRRRRPKCPGRPSSANLMDRRTA